MLRLFAGVRMRSGIKILSSAHLVTSLLLTATAQSKPETDIRPLAQGQGVERELKGGELHSYALPLRAGQFLSVIVQQEGIDVVVTLLDPADKKLAEVDSPNGVQGPEPLSSIAEADGIYHLEVRSLDNEAPVGRYEAKITELRAATEGDKTRIAAQTAFAEGVALQAQESVEGFRGAVNKYEQALKLYKIVDDKEGQALMLQSSGVLYRELGENDRALDYFNQALPLRRATNDKVGEADALIGIGFVYFNLGENAQALKFYSEALPLTRFAGDTVMEATTLNNIGTVYSNLGENDKALRSYTESLPLFRAAGDKRAEATMLGNIGKVYADLGKHSKALEFYSESLPLRRAVGDKNGEAATLNNIGVTYRDLGEKEKALKYYIEALDLRRAIGDRSGEAGTLNNMAVVYFDLGQKEKALELYGDCLPLFRAIGDKRGEANTLDNLMDAWGTTGNPRLGVFFGKLSVGVYQILRSNVNPLDKSIQQTFLRSIEQTYRQLAGIMIDQHRYAEAQELLNAFKDQQVFDPDRSVQRSPLSLTTSETAAASALDQRIEKVADSIRKLEGFKSEIGERQSTADETTELRTLERQLRSAGDAYRDFLGTAAAQFANLSESESRLSKTQDLQSMQDSLRQLSKDTGEDVAAVYQLVGTNKFQSLVITAGGIKSVSSPVTSKVVNDSAKKFWALIQGPEYEPRTQGKTLYDVVFKPLEKELPAGTKTILWSLDGNLRYIPMAALFDGKQFLVERYNNVMFTRADSDRMTRAVSPAWIAAAFGSTRSHTVDLFGAQVLFGTLPGVGREMDALFGKSKRQGVLQGDVLLDGSFTRKSMLERLQQKRPVVHIASHFSFRPGDESRSFLLLGDGTPFTLADMKEQRDMFAGVELLTLSACNTAAQQADANGREVDAFFELAQRLGAQSVMATLWPVADNSTPWLMREFYDLKVHKKQNKAEALRNAQLALLNGSAKTSRSTVRSDASQVKIVVEGESKATETENETRAEKFTIAKKDAKPFIPDTKRPFAHPFYWSPFVLIGNWR